MRRILPLIALAWVAAACAPAAAPGESTSAQPKPLTPAIIALSGISVADDHTVVVSWGTPYVDAGTGGPPVRPKHILADASQTDKQGAFVNSSYWGTNYISDGAYKITKYG